MLLIFDFLQVQLDEAKQVSDQFGIRVMEVNCKDNSTLVAAYTHMLDLVIRKRRQVQL